MNIKKFRVIYLTVSIVLFLTNIFLWGKLLENSVQNAVWTILAFNLLISFFAFSVTRKKGNTFVCKVCGYRFPLSKRMGAGFSISTPFLYKEYIFCEKCNKEQWCELKYEEK